MKPTPTSQPELAPLLAFGAHPDDIEFGCGAVIALETRAGRAAYFVVCSRGESASNGTPQQRATEAQKSAEILAAALEFVDLGGDAHFEHSTAAAISLARIIRQRRPGVVLSPAPMENQHPDHVVLSRLVLDAARLARYGGVKELSDSPPHAVEQLLFYSTSCEGEPEGHQPVLVDVSDASIMSTWRAAMEAHASQMRTRNYVELQVTRARLNGLRAGVEHAIALFPADPIVIDSLAKLGRGARRF